MGSLSPGSAAPLLAAKDVAKRFGGEPALAGVDLEVHPGEIHALLGENGAGKSTLIKALAGVVQRDAGEITVRGRALPRHHSPADAAAAGLAFVHQDLGLADGLSVAENVALQVGYERRSGLISYARTERRVGEILEQLGIDIAPRSPVHALSQDQKVMVAVARAFSLDAHAIVLDEVSSSLPSPAVARLARALRAAAERGLGFVYVTHRLEELFDFADRATVLRDGSRVAVVEAEALDHDLLVEHILGAPDEDEVPVESPAGAMPASEREAPAAADVRLRVRDLLAPGIQAPVGFDAAPGEVVAFCGLVGCGAREVAGVIGGAVAPSSGVAELDDEPLALGDSLALRRAGCTYVPGDRQSAGGVLSLSVRENLFLRPTPTPGRRWPLRRSAPERRRANEVAARFGVRPPDGSERPLWTLSGGNQQKVITARALTPTPRLLVVDDPTAGVDVGSRVQLHGILRAAAAEGTVVVIASTDYEEVASQADRAYVMHAGRVEVELSGAELRPDRLAQASYGTNDREER